MKPDHEAAKKMALRLVDERCAGIVDIAYLDAMARPDKAEKECGDLLGRARDMLCDGWTEIEMAAWLADYRAFIER